MKTLELDAAGTATIAATAKGRRRLPARWVRLTGLAGAAVLAFLSASAAQAVPLTYADVYFRRTIENPFTDPGYFEQQAGASQVTLVRSRPEGSTARAEGDAASGTLKTTAHAVTAFAAGQEAWARGHIDDRFTVDGGVEGTPLHITVTYTVDGWLRGGSSDAGTLAAFDNAYVGTRFIAGTGNLAHSLWARTETEMGACWISGCAGFAIPIHWVEEIELEVLSGQAFDIHYALDTRGGWAYGGSAGTADFGSTGSLSFNLPVGTRISSLGGFSQAASNGVPEPPVFLLLVLGLAALTPRIEPRARR